MLSPRYAAEAQGTFALVFLGAGAVTVDALYGGMLTHLGVATAFGLVVMAVIYAFGEISGAHINPAVTLGFWAAGRLPGRDVLPFVASQAVGAIAAGALLLVMFPTHPTLGATVPTGTDLQSLVMEVVLTGFLMTVILHVSTGAKEKGIMAGAAIGGTVALAALVGGPVSGASLNPARTLGPAVASGTWTSFWIYLVGPATGVLLAVLSCRFLRRGDCCPACDAGPTAGNDEVS